MLQSKNRRQYRYPCTDDIMYIDSDKHNVTLHLSDGSEIITVDKLGEIEKRINEKTFSALPSELSGEYGLY